VRQDVSIPGVIFAATLALAATIGSFVIPTGKELTWLCMFGAALTLFFGSLPADKPARSKERE
jgi:hypothetical protein